MKILFITTISNTINAFLIPHIKMLINQGHQVDVAFNIQQEVDQEIVNLGCKIHIVEFKRSPLSKGNYYAYKDLKKILESEKYDLIHTHTPVASAISRLACKGVRNVKVIYTAHGFHFHKGASVKNWLIYYPIEKYLSKYTDCLITINEEDYRTAIDRKFKSKGIKIVHGMGVDLNIFEPQTIEKRNSVRKDYGYSEDDFILFYAAELNSNKHQGLLIDTISTLKNRIPNIKLLLAGSGVLEEQYKEQARDLKLNKNIEFLGFRSDVKDLLTLSDIAVASSKREGLPVNVMEAMATGLPLVVTNVRGHRDLVQNDVNGYVVGLDDTEGFSNSIEKLYNDRKLRNQLGSKSIELVKKYSLENVIGEMEEIYELYLGGK